MTDYIKIIINLLSPDKRTNNIMAFLSPIAYQIQVDNNNLFNLFKVGASYNKWNNLTTYNRYDVVQYGKQVYYSSIDDNLGIYPDNVNWILVSDNFIGTDSRVLFNGTKLIFEYAINTYFETTYQPDTTLNSEIYLETVQPQLKSFMVAKTEKYSDNIFKNNSSGYIKKTDMPGEDINLIIWVKDLGTVGKPSYDEVKQFADKYIVAGVKYKISNY